MVQFGGFQPAQGRFNFNGMQGPQGPQGFQGPRGPQGPQGAGMQNQGDFFQMPPMHQAQGGENGYIDYAQIDDATMQQLTGNQGTGLFDRFLTFLTGGQNGAQGPQNPGDPQPHLNGQGFEGGIQGGQGPQKPGDPQPHLGQNGGQGFGGQAPQDGQGP